MNIDQLLADALAEADTLRRFGANAHADAVASLLATLKGAPEFRAFLTWHGEAEAESLSGHAADWFRQRFAYFEGIGLARKQGRLRQYRETLVRAVCTNAALLAAQREAEHDAKEAA